MGFLKQAKADWMAGEASRAAAEGRRVFVARIEAGTLGKAQRVSGPIGHVAEAVEAVEDAGWRLDQFRPMDDGVFVCLFRRV